MLNGLFLFELLSALERACDACYTRRVKCSKTEPCDHCIRLKVS